MQQLAKTTVVETAGWAGEALEWFPSVSFLGALRTDEGVDPLPGARKIKSKRGSSVWEAELGDEGRTRPVVLKIRRSRNPFRFAALCRCKRAFEMGRAIFGAGLPAPEPYGYFRSLKGRTCLFVDEKIQGVVPLREALPGLADRAAVMGNLGGLLGRFHDAGFFHGDCTLKNFLFRPSDGALFVFDLDHAHFLRRIFPPLRGIARIHDLRDIWVSGRRILSHGEKETFFEAYAKGRLKGLRRFLWRRLVELVPKRH